MDVSEPGGAIVIIQDPRPRIPRYGVFAFHEIDRDPLMTLSTGLVFPPTSHLHLTFALPSHHIQLILPLGLAVNLGPLLSILSSM